MCIVFCVNACVFVCVMRLLSGRIVYGQSIDDVSIGTNLTYTHARIETLVVVTYKTPTQTNMDTQS